MVSLHKRTMQGHAKGRRLALRSSASARFSGYELLNGYIRPKAGAVREGYDAWAKYEASTRLKRGAPPYQSLLELAHKLKLPRIRFRLPQAAGSRLILDPDREGIFLDAWRRISPLNTLSREQENVVLSWCADWGLLGILFTRTLSVAFEPIDEDLRLMAPDLVSELEGTRLQGMTAAVQTVISRANGCWQKTRVGILRSPRFGLVGFDRQPARAVVQDLGFTGAIVTRVGALRKFWWPYFPDVRSDVANQFGDHAMETEEFWRGYAEPLDEFLWYTAAFASAIRDLKEEPEPLAINYFLAGTGEWITVGSGGCQSHLGYPSLLAAFARMAVQDASSGRTLLTCECCGGLFVTSAYQARYCSPQCQWRDNKRRTRGAETETASSRKSTKDGKKTRK